MPTLQHNTAKKCNQLVNLDIMKTTGYKTSPK